MFQLSSSKPLPQDHGFGLAHLGITYPFRSASLPIYRSLHLCHLPHRVRHQFPSFALLHEPSTPLPSDRKLPDTVENYHVGCPPPNV